MQLVKREILFKLLDKRIQEEKESDNEVFSYSEFLSEFKKSRIKYPDIKTHGYSDAYKDILENYIRQYSQNIKFISEGSSRAAFACLGGKCLKVAMNKKGIAQNIQEIKNFKQAPKYSCFAQLYDFDSQDKCSLMTECCSTAEDRDFQKLYGSPDGLESVCNVLEKIRLNDFDIDSAMKEMKRDIAEDKEWIRRLPEYDMDRQHFEENISMKEWKIYMMSEIKHSQKAQWKVLRDLLAFYKADGRKELSPGDLQLLENWGLAIRFNAVVPVIIDAGFNDKIGLEYYDAFI